MKSLYTLSFLLLLKLSTLNAQKTITICEGDSTQLTTAIVGLDYSWITIEGLSNSKIRNPFAKPTTKPGNGRLSPYISGPTSRTWKIFFHRPLLSLQIGRAHV